MQSTRTHEEPVPNAQKQWTTGAKSAKTCTGTSHPMFSRVCQVWINSAGRISSRISDFWGEHSAGRIRHFREKFEQNKGKSVALMICLTLVRKNENVHCRLFLSCKILIKKITISTNIMKWYSDLALDNEYRAQLAEFEQNLVVRAEFRVE